MKRKFFMPLVALMLVIPLAFGLAACGKKKSKSDDGAGSGAGAGATATITSVTVTPATWEFTAEGTKQLSVNVVVTNNAAKTVTWSSSNDNVATVSNAGLVTAVANGTTTITATSTVDATKKGTCVVTVDVEGLPVAATALSELYAILNDDVNMVVIGKDEKDRDINSSIYTATDRTIWEKEESGLNWHKTTNDGSFHYYYYEDEHDSIWYYSTRDEGFVGNFLPVFTMLETLWVNTEDNNYEIVVDDVENADLKNALEGMARIVLNITVTDDQVVSATMCIYCEDADAGEFVFMYFTLLNFGNVDLASELEELEDEFAGATERE